jgi:carbohydrate kinase (thermoresistant glucokinase family)
VTDPHPTQHQFDVIIVMGVSGVGKTTVGRALAHSLGFEYVEGDDYHPSANVEKMRRGIPLDDDDRAPWLTALASAIEQWIAGGRKVVLSCSALKRDYRAQLIRCPERIRLVYLSAERGRIARRIEGRRGHFMPADLLDSQLATLEPPGVDERPIVVCAEGSPDAIAARVVTELRGST